MHMQAHAGTCMHMQAHAYACVDVRACEDAGNRQPVVVGTAASVEVDRVVTIGLARLAAVNRRLGLDSVAQPEQEVFVEGAREARLGRRAP